MCMPYWKMILAGLMLSMQVPALAAGTPVNLYKNPNCGCCDLYAEHLEANGFAVKLINTTDMTSIRKKYGVPEKLEGCHTAIINGYVFEGLIPAEYVKRVLTERKPIKGIALPGMPVGAPGMPGNKRGPLTIYHISGQATPAVYASF